jgi:hypothetical protein
MREAWTELPFPEGLGLDHTKSAFSDASDIASRQSIRNGGEPDS